MVAVLIFNHIYWFWSWTTLDKLVTMATTKGLSLICKIPNFANAYLGKVTKFQGYGLFRSGVLSNLQVWRWKTPPPLGMNMVKHNAVTKETTSKHKSTKLSMSHVKTLYQHKTSSNRTVFVITNNSSLPNFINIIKKYYPSVTASDRCKKCL